MTMTTTERKRHQRDEALKDRRAYRQTLIQRRNDIESRIATVEAEIRKIEEQGK